MKKVLLTTLFSLTILSFALAQFGIGLVGGNDIYQRYTNPEDDFAGPSAGNAILNLTFGPKIWIGGEEFSVSVEAHANWGSTAFSLRDYKGMGAVGFPVLMKLNFGGNSGFNSELKGGWSIGGGYQWSRTELYGLNRDAENIGVERSLFPTFIGEISRGYGISGFVIELFGRFGYNPDSRANSLNVGITYNFNVVGLRKLQKKLDNF